MCIACFSRATANGPVGHCGVKLYMHIRSVAASSSLECTRPRTLIVPPRDKSTSPLYSPNKTYFGT
eukprot:3120548-Amphidinium_carterae.1